MKIIEWPQFLDNGIKPEDKKTSMTIGIFDGVHRGHRALIERIVSFNTGFTPVIITFRQNHKTGNRGLGMQINGQKLTDTELGGIQTFQQRLAVFEKLGIQITIVIDYTEEFRRTSGMEFFNILLKRGNTGFFAVGSGFRCGYNLDIDSGVIKKFFNSHNIPAEIVPHVMEGSLPISSSRIRAAIAAGDLPLAQAMLGRGLNGPLTGC